MKRKVEAQNTNLIKVKKKKINTTKVLSAEERQRKKTSLYSAPTSEELNQLRENENLYKSNLFRMQIQYLLEEVCLKEKKVKKINDALHLLNTFIKGTCSQTEEHEISGSCLPRGVEFPLPHYISKEKIKGKFRYIAPKEITVIGSYLLKTMTKPRTSIDIAVEMPMDCFQPRDSLNFRYYFKRAAYLSWLAFYLKDWELTDSLHFSCTYNQYKPILCLTLKGKSLKSYFINIHLAIPNGVFKLSRFTPLTSNIRTSWFCLDTSKTADSAIPTPHYNSGILSDMLFEDHLKVLYAAIKECPAIREAVCLFKVWLKQRTFKGACTFNGFVGSMFMVFLLKKKQISFNLSSYQIFKIAMHSLATSDWSNNGITLCDDAKKSLVSFHEKFDVVFVDSTGELNLCADITKLTYNMIRYQATLSLSILDNSMEGGFDPLFIKQQHFLQVADHSFRLNNLVDFHKQLVQNQSHKAAIMDFGGDWLKLVPNIVSETLLSGLDKRVRLLFEKPAEEKQWTVTSCMGIDDFVGYIWFGLLLDPEYSENVLSMGPSADQPEAKIFRKIWGAKSELRRFPDGSINEAVLWPCVNKEETKFICKQIVQHLLQLHCKIPSTNIFYHGGEFNVCLKRKYIETDDHVKNKPGCGEEEGINFIKTFEKLCKEISAIENLPLKIHSIDGIDPAFRMTEVNTPLQHITKAGYENKIIAPKFEKKLPRFCPVYNVVLQFETSGKWPDDVLAIQHIKAAFHLKLADSIRSSINIPAVASPGFVDVIKNGYVFRISVVNYREMVLYQENLNVGSLLKKECGLAAHQLDIIIVKKPLHNSLIKSLNSQYHEYPLTVRLAKKWIAAQMFSEFLSEEALELIVAFLFLCPQPSEAPRCHMSGFIRFLEFMCNHDWNNEPVIVNLNNQITNDEFHKIKENFELNRDQLPPMCVACSYDHQGGLWTKNINKQILRRLSLLADSALKYIDSNIWSNVSISVEPIFRPPISDYHVLIELKKEMVPLYYLNIDSNIRSKSFAIKDSIVSTCMPVADFNPPKLYLEELRSAFSEIALFFYDAYGGINIGVIWKLSALTPQPFKILHARYQTLVKTDIKKPKKKIVPCSTPMSIPNISAIIDDFKVIGRGLVNNVTVLKKN
ncbi:nucleolar protein 6-like [Hydra vulgaris]|uniref:Nucleolar protein 6 n=1 Tax=Hydra vulgaris TaxID=6087 RepID=A0ABM4DN55_HYDVU